MNFAKMNLLFWLYVLFLLPCFGAIHSGSRIRSKLLPKAIYTLNSLNVAPNVALLPSSANVTMSDSTITVFEASPPTKNVMRGFMSLVSITSMFLMWYVLSASHNVYNVYVKAQFPFPVTTACLQLLIGFTAYAVPLYLLRLRSTPNFASKRDFLPLIPIAVCNTIGHVSALAAVFQVGGSLAHVVKSLEPVVSVFCLLIWNKVVPMPLTTLSLIPISYGVAHASTLGNLNLQSLRSQAASTVTLLAMLSNVAFSMRSILRRNLSREYKARTRLTPANEHAVTTLLSFFMSLLLMFRFEPPALTLTYLRRTPQLDWTMLNKDMLMTSICLYVYNEIQNGVLSRLGPVTTAVGSTLKRAVIFVALHFFTPGDDFPQSKVVGCTIAVLGCLFYAIFESFKI